MYVWGMTVVMPRTLDEALDALSRRPGATVVAGGTDVMVEVNMGHRRFAEAVMVHRVPELRTWTHDPVAGTLTLGAAVTWAEVEAGPIADWVPALAQAARTVGSPQIRHAGTVGGNLGTCSPAGDGLPPLAALGAVVHLRSAAGARDLPFAEYMTGPKRTARRSDELVTGVTVPLLGGWQGYSKVGVRNAMVIATASAALVVDPRPGSAEPVRLALGSVGPTVLRCAEAEQHVAGAVAAGRVSEADVRRFAELASSASRPIDDHRATAAYRRHAVGVLAARLLRRAFPDG